MSLASVDRYDPSRVHRIGGQAVVIGAGVAGLLAARVLADAFDRVVVLDRDPLDAATGTRRGVPQAQHPHALLVAGQVVMEDLLPGFVDDLVASGAVTLDLSREASTHAAEGFIAPGSGGMPMYFASRPLIERVLRVRVADHDRVALRSGRQVTDHLASGDGAAIEGVVVHHDGEQHTIPAELVVDASGRASRASTWLGRLGYAPPPTEKVHVDVAYRTCQVQRPTGDRRAVLVMPSPPRARGGFLVPIEGDRWLVALSGLHGDHPPGDLEGLREFAAGLPTPMVREVLEEHPLATPGIAHYRFPTNTRHRYDQLEAVPAGLVSVGDAITSFNPIYGQGMSVAALEALELHHILAEHGVEHLAPTFYARTAKVIEGAWNISAGGDFQFPQTHGPKPRGTATANRYIARLHRKAHTDGRLADAFRRVAAMEQPPTSLFHPRVAWPVLRPQLPLSGHRRRTGDPRPASA